MADVLQEIATNLYDGDDEKVAELVQQALDEGMAPGEVLNGGLVTGMDEVGKDFKAGELFVPEVLIAARWRPFSGTGGRSRSERRRDAGRRGRSYGVSRAQVRDSRTWLRCSL